MQKLASLDQLRILQASVLAHRGVDRLMDVMRDSREYVRNEGLLLMISLCEFNQEIQKITAFSSAFECLFHIIDKEVGNNDVIVLDALKLTHILLHGNPSNVMYFRETGCGDRLLPLLKVEGSDVWMLTDSKQEIVICALQILRALIPRHSSTAAESRHLLHKLGYSNVVLKLSLGRVNSLSIRMMALEVLGDFLLDESNEVRNWFQTATVFLPLQEEAGMTDMAQPALPRLVTVLLFSPSFNERITALGTFRCYLHSNEGGQIEIVTTITPSPNEIDEMEGDGTVPAIPLDSPNSKSGVGRRVMACLFSWNEGEVEKAERAWFACKVIAESLKNPTVKLHFLRTPLRMTVQDKELTTLMAGLVEMLQRVGSQTSEATPASSSSSSSSSGASGPTFSQNRRSPETKVILAGIMYLLITWMHECEEAVKAFIADPRNISILAELSTNHSRHADTHIQGFACLLLALCLTCNPDEPDSPFNKENLRGIITSIGREKLIETLSRLRFSKEFIGAEQDEFESGTSDEYEEADLDPQIPLSKKYDLWDVISMHLYDFDFTFLFKTVYESAMKALGTGKRKEKQGSSTPTPVTTEAALRVEYEQQIEHYKQLLEEAKSAQPVAQEATLVSDSLKEMLKGDQLEIGADWTVERTILEYKQMYQSLLAQNKGLEETMQSMSGVINDYEALVQQNQQQGDISDPQFAEAMKEKETLIEERTTMTEIIQRLETENALLREESKGHEKRANELLEKSKAGEQGEDRIRQLEEEVAAKEASVSSLEAEQEELLLCLVKEEMEVAKLRERVRQLEMEKGIPQEPKLSV